MWVLFTTASIGVIVYLNLKAGPSYGGGFLPANAAHEARERDYFFVLAFVCWGLWAGFGAVTVMRRLAHHGAGGWAPLGVLVALLPLFLNWSAVDRRGKPVGSEATNGATRILASAPRDAIVLARGDNETYPVWYMQEVEKLRPDVTVVVVPLLPAKWYRAELERRHALIPTPYVTSWSGSEPTLSAVCSTAAAQRRRVMSAAPGPDSKFPAVCETR